MANQNEDKKLAVFCDFENVALGVRDAKYAKFDIQLVLERLLLKGSIIMKKAYCDWERYKEFKPTMHEAAFELIEIPHTRQSGKNSADIRMVVDALDLCYTKEHMDTFVIISGDSDFSPLVSKLRENAKTVIGVGVKNSTSDLLISNCDEFIYYDDLVRDLQTSKKRQRKRAPKKAASAAKVEVKDAQDGQSKDSKDSKDVKDTREAARSEPPKQDEDLFDEAIGLVLDTAEALYAERGERERLWGSMVKQTLKRRRPGFNESFYGFRSFSDLLEEAENRGQLQLEMDERSGGYLIKALKRED